MLQFIFVFKIVTACWIFSLLHYFIRVYSDMKIVKLYPIVSDVNMKIQLAPAIVYNNVSRYLYKAGQFGSPPTFP